VISAQAFPERPGWLFLRGGPVASLSPEPSLRRWLEELGTQGRLVRVEATAPASSPVILDWWRHSGFVMNGIAEIGSEGNAAEIALSWSRTSR